MMTFVPEATAQGTGVGARAAFARSRGGSGARAGVLTRPDVASTPDPSGAGVSPATLPCPYQSRS